MTLALSLMIGLTAAGGDSQAALAAAWPTVAWIEGQGIAVDMDGDGRTDWLAFGREGDQVVVGLFRAAGEKPTRKDFDASHLSCSPPTFSPACDMSKPAMRVERLDATLGEDLALMFDLEDTSAFELGGRAEAVVMPVGETDPIWFYWNKDAAQLDWLRL